MKPDLKNKRSIIVLDDEPDIREFLRLVLWEAGFPIIPVDSVDEALNQLRKNQVGLILSDIRLPGKSGIDLLKEAKKTWPEIPFILMTGYSDISREEAQRLGAVTILNKPLDLKTLIPLIEWHYNNANIKLSSQG